MKIKMEIATCQIFYAQIQLCGLYCVGKERSAKGSRRFSKQHSSLLGALIDYSNLPARPV